MRALLAVCLGTGLLALAAPAGAETGIHYTRESFGAFQHQLNAGQIHAVVFNKKAHTMHLEMSDGRRLLVSYPSHNEPQLAALITARGVPVTVPKHTAKPVHHTLRYVAGGILIVVIIVILGVLLVGRRRGLVEGQGDGPAQGGEAPSAPPPAGTG